MEWDLTNCLIGRSGILGRNKPVTKQIYISKLTRRYRILLEESFTSERQEVRNPDRRWDEIIPCQGFKPGPPQEGPFISLYLRTRRPYNFIATDQSMLMAS